MLGRIMVGIEPLHDMDLGLSLGEDFFLCIHWLTKPKKTYISCYQAY